jgi:hypothetical protein
MAPLYKQIVVKGFWQHAQRDPTLFVNTHTYYKMMLKSNANSNSAQTKSENILYVP